MAEEENKDKKEAENISKYVNENAFTIPQSCFSLPEMGDFYLGAVDDVYLRKIDAVLNKKAAKTDELKSEEKGDAEKAAYYLEAPSITKTGFDDNKYLLKVEELTNEDHAGGWMNANTFRAKIGNLAAEDEAALAVFKLAMLNKGQTEQDRFQVDLYGISAPTPGRWATETNVPKSKVKRSKMSISDIEDDDDYVFNKSAAKGKELEFVQIHDKYYQMEAISETDNNINFRWLMSPASGTDENINKSIARANLLLEQAKGEIYILTDGKAKKGELSSLYNVNSTAILSNWAQDAVHGGQNGYCLLTEDQCDRLDGEVYLKIDGKWVNFAKAIIAEDNPEIKSSSSNVGGDGFKHNYNPEDMKYVDAFMKTIDSLDDRKAIQKEIYGKNWDTLHDWTVTLGDVTLFVPPTNIVCTTESEEERIPILRGNGSMVKSGSRVVRFIRMTIYFAGDKGINGFKKTVKSPSGKEFTYSLNGLRALVSEFKFMPFIPIENDYINNTLDIEAVVFNNISISSQPSFPRLYEATITMTEFTWLTYMPEHFALCASLEATGNWFAKAINWATARHYYQHCIMAGDTIGQLKYAVNSKEYWIACLQNKTALQPMQFKSSKIKFYIADTEYLQKLLDARMQRYNERNYSIAYSTKEKVALIKIGEASEGILKATESQAFKKALAALNKIDGQIVYNTKEDGFHKTTTSEDELLTTATCRDTNIKLYKDGKETTYDVNPKINNVIGTLIDGIQRSVPNIDHIKTVTRVSTQDYESDEGAKFTAGRYTFGLAIKFKGDVFDDKEAMQSLREDCSTVLGCSDKNLYKDGYVIIPVSIDLSNKDSFLSVPEGYLPQNGGFYLNVYDPDMKFLDYCQNYYNAHKNDSNTTSNAKDTTDWSKPLDLAKLDNIEYVEYDCGDFIVEAFNAGLTNKVSRINMQGVSGASPQYLGGEDISFEVRIKTTDRKAVVAITKIPKVITTIIKQYRQIIPCSPVKVDSEFTRFFGVNEVTITNVNAETVPKQPGVYTITLCMRSVDRTLREREAMQMLELNNAINYAEGTDKDNSALYYFKQMLQKEGLSAKTLGIGALNRYYELAKIRAKEDSANNQNATKQVLSYYDINDKIATAEIYPDLELPRIDDLKDLGWDFIRYKFQDSRVYVDPDFYYVYFNTLSSQLLRETVTQSVKYGVDGSVTYEDATGAKMTIKPEKFCGYSIADENEIMKKQMQGIKNAKKAKYNLSIQQMYHNIKDRSKNVTTDFYDQWEIAKTIKGYFLEKEYKKEYDSYVARQKTKDAQKNKTTNSNDNEGKWLYGQLENARSSSKIIKEYLANNPITVKAQQHTTEEWTKVLETLGTEQRHNETKKKIFTTTSSFLKKEEVIKAFKLLDMDVTNASFINAVQNIVYAAACDATGGKEYSSKKNSDDWRPTSKYFGENNGLGIQDFSKATLSTENAEEAENATKFGCFGIKLYNQQEMLRMLPDTALPNTDANDAGISRDRLKNVNSTNYLLDPYYQTKSADDILLYKLNCIQNVEYCTEAYLRIVLLWMSRLVDKQVFPSVNADILRKTLKNELNIQKIQEERGVGNKEKDALLQQHISFFSKNTYSFDAGKIWTAICLANSDCDKNLLDKIEKRDYKALNEYARCCTKPASKVDPNDRVTMMMRKLNMALIGLGTVNDASALGVKQNDPTVKKARELTEKKYIEAAEDPKQYMLHSCHDMIVHDARGRMLRAFPTYYLIFIDEGREVGTWKLHDNFYNSSSISEFQVVKNRKNPADTAIIKMTNMFQTYTTESDDRLVYPTTTMSDAFSSIFSGEEYGKKQELKRKIANSMLNMRIRDGARVHLRAGYGANPAMLPIIFNGCIAEVTTEELLTIIAQGDGVELTNPIYEEMEARELLNMDDFLPGKFSNGATPKEIMHGLLTANGGFIKSFLKGTGLRNLLSDNPFGIYHFGNKDFTSIVASGEPTQNIYEAWAKPVWGDESVPWADNEAPEITFDLFNKTVWDVAHICKSVMPDFICGVAPFGFRSTLFIGLPRYYYAYDYVSINGAIQEKRKPYQQYHIYTSACDIIANAIAASSRTMKTTAIGLYQQCHSFNIKEQHKVGPLYADIDIYPENQKSMIVDTQLLGKGPAIVGTITNFLTSFETIDDAWDDKGAFVSHRKIAWRMTASALKDSMKEMYCGDLIVLGDPTVKPFDRLFLLDDYAKVSGQCEVREVVHNMSVDQGFTTTIVPDCIITVDDPFEHVVHNWFKTVAGPCASNIVSLVAIGTASLIGTPTLFGSWVGKILGSQAARVAVSTAAEASTWAGSTTAGAYVAQKWNTAKLTAQAIWKAITSVEGSSITSILSGGAARGISGILAAIFGNIPLTILVLGVSFGCKYLSTAIDDLAKNMQVTTVYPLLHHDTVWTAGLAGSKGMVYGSPSYNEQGLLTQAVINATLGLKDDNLAVTIFDKIFGFLASEEAQNYAKKLQRNTGNIDSDGNSTQKMSDDEIAGLYQHDLHKNKKYLKSTNDYRQLYLTNRVNINNKQALKDSYDILKIINTKTFQNDPKFENNIFIEDDKRFDDYMEDGFFKIIHDEPTLNEGKKVETITINKNGKQKRTKIIKDNDIIDLPMLNQEAVHVLYEIIRRTKNYMPAANASDEHEAYEETKNSYIILESALRVGDTKSYASTGYTFILHAIGNAQEPLNQAIKSLETEYSEKVKEGILACNRLSNNVYQDGRWIVNVSLPRLRKQDK